MAAVVPVAIRFLAEKDASVDRVAGEVRGQLANAGTAIQVSAAPVAGNSLAEIQKLREALEATRAQAAATGSEMEKLKAGSGGAAAPKLRPPLDDAAEAAKRLRDATREAAEQQQRLATIGREVGTALTVAGATMLGLAGASIAAAGNFEQLRAKLVTLKGTAADAANTFEFARKLAAATPFDVQGVVAATVTLEAYKQKAETTLPAVANLAAGMGKRIEDAALVVGKATSGSLEGFESLRNEYGITTADLQKFGAQVTSTGGILARTPEQVEKARNALLQLISLRFGDAVERQAATFQGGLSNASDAVQNTAARIGDTLLPLGNTIVRTFTGAVEIFGSLPTPILAVAGAALVLGGGLATMAGTSILAVAGLVAVNAQLSVAAEKSAAAAFGYAATSRSLSFLGSAATLAGGALRFLTLTPVGLAITGVSLAVAGAVAAMNSYAASSAAAGRELDDQSHKTQALIQDYRGLLDVVNAAGRSKGIALNVGSSKEDIGSALAKVRPEDLAAGMQAAGRTTQDLKKTLDGLRDQQPILQAQIRSTVEALADLKTEQTNTKESGNSYQSAQVAQGAVDEQRSLQISGQTEKLGQLKSAYVENAAAIKAFADASSVLDQMAARLERVVREGKRTQDFLNFAKAEGSTQSLVTAQALLGDRIQRNAKIAEIGFKTIAELNQELLSPKFDAADLSPALSAQKAAIEQAIKDKLAEADITKDIATRNKDAQLKIVADQEDTFARQGAVHQKTVAEQIAFQDQLISEYKKLGEAGIALETQAIVKRAALVKEGHQDRLNAQKAAASEELAAAKEKLSEATSAPGNTSATRSVAIDAYLARVAEIKIAFKSIGPDIDKLFDAPRNSGLIAKAAEQAKALTENMQTAKEAIAEFSAEAITSTEKRASAERGIALIRNALNAGLLDEKQAQKEITALTRQRADAERQVTAEVVQRQAGLRSQELQAQESVLQSLKTRKADGDTKDDSGKDINRAIQDANQEKLRQQLDNIEKTRQAGVDAARSDTDAVADINRKASLERQAIIRAEEESIRNELRETTKVRQGEIDKQRGRNGNNLFSGVQSSALPVFGDNFGQAFDFGKSRSPFAQSFPNSNQIRARVANQVAEADRLNKPKDSIGAGRAPLSPGSETTIHNNTINVKESGRVINFTDPEFDRNVERVLRKNTARDKKGTTAAKASRA